MSKIKVIVMDVDGTLTNSEKKITEKTKNALLKAQDSGIKIILASGRSTMGLSGFAEELNMHEHDGLLVSYNGSKVVDLATNETLFDEPLSNSEIKRILNHVKKFNITPMIDHEQYLYVNNLDGVLVDYESSSNNYKLKFVEDMEASIDFDSNKILTSGEPEYLQEIFEEMKEPFIGEFNCMFTAPFYVEYTANGIDKAKALDSVLSPMGYQKDEIMAIGDGHNDISMLQYAGVAIAMDNAVKELKDIATYVTLSNEEDGIAHALNKFLD